MKGLIPVMLAASMFGWPAVPANAQSTVPVPVLANPAQAGTLLHDHLVLVEARPDECPATYKGRRVTWYHALVGGNDNADRPISRATRRCVVIDADPIKSTRGGWESDSPYSAPPEQRQPERRVTRRFLDAEPPPGQLAKGEVVYVSSSQCEPGKVLKVTGASGKNGRRSRECVSL
ncbi:MAG TPA: hypothetical protein VNM40_01705 [Candidatus Paceibacterota bacterium]|nr:hypothetical protein [Candidatus Paceibacterota bacterium]